MEYDELIEQLKFYGQKFFNEHIISCLYKNAATAIESLLTERNAVIAELNRNPKMETGWISVYDRMPEKGIPVLVWKDGEIRLAKRCYAGSWASLTFKDFELYGVYWLYGPTHWMPLPTPPDQR